MTNTTRQEALLQKQIEETEKKKKGVDLLTFLLMLATLLLALFGILNYAIITLLLSTIGLTASNTLGTKLQILEREYVDKTLDGFLVE